MRGTGKSRYRPIIIPLLGCWLLFISIVWLVNPVQLDVIALRFEETQQTVTEHNQVPQNFARMQEEGSRTTMSWKLGAVSLAFVLLFIILSINLVRVMRRESVKELQDLEKEKVSREYIKKLEMIGKEVRRLRDLGAAIDATAGILIFNQQHLLQSVNDGFRQLRGFSSEPLMGRTISSILGLDDEGVARSIQAALIAKQIWRGELSSFRVDGTGIWLYVLFYPELDDLDDLEGSLALVLDITENKKAQITLGRTRHLTALGEMAGGIAHEINNPLSVITGRTASLLKKAQTQSLEPAVLISGLEQIQRTVTRIAKIVDSMRRLSRSDASQTENRPELLELIVRETLEFTEDKVRQNQVQLTIHYEQGAAETQVLLRGFGLSQILINLVNNAVDAIVMNEYPERWIRLESHIVSPEKVCVRVIDSGRGIDKGIRDKIMNPFFTTKPAGVGTGLGLSLSLTIAEEHGGRIYYDEDCQNTSFVLELPIYRAGGESPSEVA